MRYMFDTDTVSFFMMDNPKNIRLKTSGHEKDEFCISAITYAELMFGLTRNYSKQLDFWLHEVVKKFSVIDFNDSAAVIYGNIRAALEKSGKLLDNMDMLIAASALSAKAILVTHNIRHFSKIKGLIAEDWS
ncbi:MAG: PIN domain-containing protein [Treponema sp.]|nr:PIN domain-containing protein [Treponema sp.]